VAESKSKPGGRQKSPSILLYKRGRTGFPPFQRGARGNFTDREGRVVKLPLAYSFSN